MDYPNVDTFSLDLIVLIVFSSFSFVVFGFSCLFSPYMITEFERYGLPKFRVLNGYFQLIGALALLGGFFVVELALIGSSGLGVLMFLGVMVRIKIKDTWLQSIPAFFYMVLNFYIFWLLLES